MSWTAADVDGFKKGLSKKQKKKWVSVANGVLKACLEDGMAENLSSEKAIRIANSNFEIKQGFNPVLDKSFVDKILNKMMEDMPEESKARMKQCMENGGSMKDCHDKEMAKQKAMSEAVEMEIY